MMKAWVSSAYGDGGNPNDAIEKLELKEVPIPEPGPGEVLIKISHAAVNPIDWKLFSGGLHSICPCTHPYTPGFDIAGTIVKLGDSTSIASFKVGDSICGDIGLVETCTNPPPKSNGCCGAFAEYCAVPTSILSKTGGIDMSIAAALPLAGLTALQGLFTRSGTTFTGEPLGNLKLDDGDDSSKKVLVLGGATLVGSYAIQLAKLAGAYVTTTASSNLMPDQSMTKLEFCKSTLGADEVIDYKSSDWTEVCKNGNYDIVYDTIGSQDDWMNAHKVLKDGCDFISVANFTADPAANPKNVFKNYLLKSINTDLDELVALVKGDKLKCPIDSVVPFSDVPAALTKNLQSLNAGKIVIKVAA
mmetsp:Transcript_213/g.319  ORF Transcript_213/g.319 Transcript_213/m.319 type:complete len:359 (-) Transcript_213:79-1155(-)|eukprot:CAMPEP_0184855948 /NCGR_PEP_ID=MMETSP0580-20130426/1120_1 /TAXON_ID=1118495 /ORGANISM="Dactyliosolen fragilissimus" /LENGTH=358 /DNA_ID=CAMNT_0027350663 /DNA_START=29 /DNA_END=1105 /DNA_ORIENTATION=-